MAKTRLDVALVERGLAETRAAAQRLVMAGLVFSGERRLDKPGQAIAADAPLEVRGQPHPYVSRGGLKLAKALDHFAIPVAGRIALDVGASTGGFTDCLLQRGAAKVYAVDVGTNQLAWKLRRDPRVISMEKTNIREVDARADPRADRPDRLRRLVHRPAHRAAGGAGARRAGRASGGADQAAVRGRQGPGGQGRHRARARAACRGLRHDLRTGWPQQPGWRVLGITDSPIRAPRATRRSHLDCPSCDPRRRMTLHDAETRNLLLSARVSNEAKLALSSGS